MSKLARSFSEDEKRRITEAVRGAEAGTSGEIVVVITDASDDYPEARWRSAFILAGLVVLADLLYRHYATFWLAWNADAVSLALIAASLLGFFAASWPPVRRSLIGRDRMSLRVRRAAEAAFSRERLFETRDRTGILIFLSWLEHEVVVLPDRGVAQRAPEQAWAGVVGVIVQGMRAGRATEALEAGLRACGETLRAAGFSARTGDVNELPDAPRREA